MTTEDKGTEGGEDKTIETTITNKEPKTVPYSKFSELNGKMRELETYVNKAKATEKKLADAELIKKGKQEEVYANNIKEKDLEIQKYKDEAVASERNWIINKYWIPENLKEFVTWNTIEEIEIKAKLLSENLKEQEQDKKKEELGDKKTTETKDDVEEFNYEGLFMGR